MDNIKWSEWDVLEGGAFHHEWHRRYSLEPVEAWVWRGSFADKEEGTLGEFRSFWADGAEDEKARNRTFQPGDPSVRVGYIAYNEKAEVEHNVFGITELECVERVLALRHKHMAQTADKYKTACKMYEDALRYKEKLGLVDEPSGDSA